MTSYCERQIRAELKVCANCRRATYHTVPSYDICMACRAGNPPIGPVIPKLRGTGSDVNGVPMLGPDY